MSRVFHPAVVSPASASGAQVIDGSVNFDTNNDDHLIRTPTLTGATRVFTWSGWVKRNVTGGTQYLHSALSGGIAFIIGIETDYFYLYEGNAGVVYTSAKLRDTNAFYHLLVNVDTMKATSTDRYKVYINGVRQYDFVSGAAFPSQGRETKIDTVAVEQKIGMYSTTHSSDFQLSQVHFFDGLIYSPQYFGFLDLLTNTWSPKKFAGTTVNDGTTWSAGTTNGSAYSSSHTWDRAFNGDLTGSGAAGGVNTPNEYNLALPNIDIYSTGVTIYGNSNSADLWLNGKQLYMTNATVYSGSVYEKTFTSEEIGSNSLYQIGMDAGLTIYAVAIGDTVLLDGVLKKLVHSVPDVNLSTTQNDEAIDVVINRKVNKCWIKSSGMWQGGGNPNDATSEPSVYLQPASAAANLYWFTTGYNTAHTITIGTSSETGTKPEWSATTGTGFTIDSVTTVTGTPSDTYVSARTGAMTDGNVYAFTFTIDAASANHSGWFLSDSSSYSSGTPDEQASGNNVGSRWYAGSSDYKGYWPFVAVYGDVAILNRHTTDSYYNGSSYAPGGYLGNRGANSFYLPFDGNSPVERDKSYPDSVNNGTVWSDKMISSSGWTEGPEKAFTNDLAEYTNAGTAGATHWVGAENLGFDGIRRIELKAYMSKVDINGSTVYTPGTAATIQKTFMVTNFDSFKVYGHGGSKASLYFVKVSDPKESDRILIDNMYNNSLDRGHIAGSVQMGNKVATGGFPILDTKYDGGIAINGARGQQVSNYYTLTGSSGSGSGYVFDGEGTKPSLSGYVGGSYTFDYSAATGHPLYLSTLDDGKHNSKAYSVDGGGTTSDYLSVTATGHSDFSLDGDFTVEWWCYRASAADNAMWTLGDSKTATGLELYWGGSGADLKLYTADTTTACYAPSVTTGWAHYAVVRHAGTIRVYVDGRVATLSAGLANTQTFAGNVYIGGEYYNSAITRGMADNISNFRLIKGQALYREYFDPPLTTLTTTSQGAIASNVKLLCCQDSNATTAAVKPSGTSVVANGDAAATNAQNPFLFNTDGYYVNTATSNVTMITVPKDCPTLYYYCNNHSGMGNSISLTTDENKADPYAWKCELADPMFNYGGDLSGYINKVRTIADTHRGSNLGGAPIFNGFGNFYGSMWFDGADDYAAMGSGEIYAHTAYDAWCFECWVWMEDVTGDQSPWAIASTDASQWFGVKITSTNITAGKSNGAPVSATYSWQPKHWHHVALTRSDYTLRLFVDGIQVGADVADANPLVTSGTCLFGTNAHTGLNYWMRGYLQDFRVYRGIPKYRKNFIVPSGTQASTLQNTPSGVGVYPTKFVDVKDGAVAFDGLTDYLDLDPDDLGIAGSDDFTMEAWVNPYNLDNTNTIFAQGGTNPASDGSRFYFSATYGELKYQISGTTKTFNIGDKALAPGRWTHISVSRVSGNLYIGLDGQVQNFGQVTSASTTQAMRIGASLAGTPADFMHGFISNARFVKGTGVYTSNYTPPTAPLTNITNTKFLGCQSPTSASDAPVGGSVNAWLPSGFTYWTAGMGANWSQSGSTTSASADYINVALPTSGKYYWETTLNNPSEYREIGLQQGADKNDGYDGKYFGFYFNQTDKEALFLTKNEQNTSRDGAVTNGATASGGGFSNGEKIMWAWDADNDKVWLGRDGTWFASGDPATGSNASIDGEDLSANSWYLKIGYNNESGATNTLTLTNVAAADSGSTTYPTVKGKVAPTSSNPFAGSVNEVRGQSTGYCTPNRLATASGVTMWKGDLHVNMRTTAGHDWATSTYGMKTGKWYMEMTLTDSRANYIFAAGFTACPGPVDGWVGTSPSLVNDFNIIYNNGTTRQIFDANVNINKYLSPAGAYEAGDTIQLAYDADARLGWFGLNGKWYNSSGESSSNPSTFKDGLGYTFDEFLYADDKEYHFCSDNHDWGADHNYGQLPFKYVPPEGFQSLNATNLRLASMKGDRASMVSNPSNYVGVVTYTGNDATDHVIGGLNFNAPPDLVWIKNWDQSEKQIWHDTVRGVGSTLYSNSGDPADTGSTYSDRFKSFDYNGFTVGGTHTSTNSDGDDFVAWCWRAGGSKDTFNKDDVGYATAAEVNMAVGSLNNYNQAATWSDNLVSSDNSYAGGQGPTQAFNGYAGGSTNMCQKNGAGGTLTWTFSGLSGSCRVWIGNAGGTVTDGNGTVRGNNVGNGETWISLSGDISAYGGSIVISVSSDAPSLGAVEVAGKMLVDDDQTPPNLPSIASTGASVNTKSGFAVITYDGNNTNPSTVAHNIGTAPEFIIIKRYDAGTHNWIVGHGAVGWTKYLYLNTDAGATASANPWNNTSPTANVWTMQDWSDMNGSSSSYVAYLWAGKPGLQKFGTYRGSGTADGPYVFTGFRPAIVMVKRYDGGSDNWMIIDDTRDKYNICKNQLYPNLVDAAGGSTSASYADTMDIVSTGFKLKYTGGQGNTAAATYLYAAWSHQALGGLYGGQSNAR